jgi:hypothetical protein
MHAFSQPAIERRIGARSVWRTAIILMLCIPAIHAIAAQAPAPVAPTPEADFTPEIIAVSVGGGVVVAHLVDDDVIIRSDGSRSASLSAVTGARAAGIAPCSRISRTATARAECEGNTRMLLTRASPSDFAQATKESFTRDMRFSFQRQSDQIGLVDTQVNGKAVRLRITTPDDLLMRVRVLGVTPTGDAVVVAESLRDDNGTMRWRSQVTSYDAKGIATPVMEIDGRDKALPNGDYAVMNERGEIGLLHMNGGALTVEWRKLAPSANSGAALRQKAAAALAAPTPPADEAALTSGFDFDRFAQLSARLDGDDGRSSDRPISRAAVADNIKGYVAAEWKMSADNYEQAGVSSECRPPVNKLWLRPRRLDSTVGQTLHALPYKWGGYVSVEGYRTQLQRKALAGSVCTCSDPDRNYCVVDNAAGIDCSGFVSRVWGVDRYTTATLSRITDAVKWRELKQGDALNNPGHHVRVFLERTIGPEIGFRIAESSVSCGGVCERVLNAREMDGYQPRRYKQIQD